MEERILITQLLCMFFCIVMYVMFVFGFDGMLLCCMTRSCLCSHVGVSLPRPSSASSPPLSLPGCSCLLVLRLRWCPLLAAGWLLLAETRAGPAASSLGGRVRVRVPATLLPKQPGAGKRRNKTRNAGGRTRSEGAQRARLRTGGGRERGERGKRTTTNNRIIHIQPYEQNITRSNHNSTHSTQH